MTPYGIVADAMYNIFGEGTQPPSALNAADDMLIKCARELDLEAPWYWLMGTRYFSLFPKQFMIAYDNAQGTARKVLPGHAYPFTVNRAVANPISAVDFHRTFKNCSGIFLTDEAAVVSTITSMDTETPPAPNGWEQNNVVSGKIIGARMARIDRVLGENLLAKTTVSYFSDGIAYDPATTPLVDDANGITMNMKYGEEPSGDPLVLKNIEAIPNERGIPSSWFFGSDPIFQAAYDARGPLESNNGEAFCLMVYPRPDKEYILVAIGEIYTSIQLPDRTVAPGTSLGSITFGNGDIETVSPMYDKALVSLVTKNMAMKFNYPQIMQIYEREYSIAMDKLRADNDRKLSYGLKLEYNDV